MGGLSGKTVIITGGSSAIGRAIALRCAGEGAKVVVADLREEPREGGKPTHEVIVEGGGKAVFVKTDVTDPADLKNAVEAAERFGGVDVLVNNAGLMRSGRLVNMTEEDFDAIMNVNVKGVYFATQAAVQSMTAAGRPGVVINLSSMGALQGMAGISAYSAAKGAVRTLTYSLAKELSGKGIRVCALHPGVIDTSMTRTDVPAVNEAGGSSDPHDPNGPVGSPEDIAGAAVFLASDEAKFITGASLTIDGGQLCIG